MTTLRTPVTATITHIAEDLETGQSLPEGTLAVSLSPLPPEHQATTNPMVSPEHTASTFRASMAAYDQQGQSIAMRIEALAEHKARLEKQTQAFVSGRIKQLKAELRGIEATISSLQAKAAIAEQQALDADHAMRTGAARRSAVDMAINHLAASQEAVTEARARREAMAVELAALKAGSFIGDSYNNLPWSAQRSTEIDLEIARLRIEMATRIEPDQPLPTELTVDTIITASMPDTGRDITLPDDLSVWEVLVSRGEIVTTGQPLVRLIQCEQAVVTASVNEGVYTRLSIGDPAEFSMRGSDKTHLGRIIRLNGQADAPANLAISPVNMDQAPYRVTVEVPGLQDGGNCPIGKAGRVTFMTGSPWAEWF